MTTIPYPVEELYEIAERESIGIEWFPESAVGIAPRGRYQVIDDARVIILSPEIKGDPMRLRCTLAHELGHHFTATPVSSLRFEALANRWAQNLLLPQSWLLEHVALPTWQIAEEAGVYQDWVKDCLKRLRQAAYFRPEGTERSGLLALLGRYLTT